MKDETDCRPAAQPTVSKSVAKRIAAQNGAPYPFEAPAPASKVGRLWFKFTGGSWDRVAPMNETLPDEYYDGSKAAELVLAHDHDAAVNEAMLGMARQAQVVIDEKDAALAELTAERDEFRAGLAAASHALVLTGERCEKAEAEAARLLAANERLREALYAINRYGLDTMSGPMEVQPDLAMWYRDGVREMVNRARAALAAHRAGVANGMTTVEVKP